MFTSQRSTKNGFTLVELLVAIMIMSILMAIAIPAINMARRTAQMAALRTEVEAISQAIESYKLKYGDYPPDFVNWNVVVSHYRKAFPDINASEIRAIRALTLTDGRFDPTAIDRAEAIVWNLGGFSSDPQRPFTGSGGPLVFFGSEAQIDNPLYYSYNASRDNALLDMKTQNLNIRPIDESQPFPSPTNRRLSSDDEDVFPVYSPTVNGTPFVYFDSRTYADFAVNSDGNPVFNGFANEGFANEYAGGVVTDGIRPMVSTTATPENIALPWPSDTGAAMRKSLGGFQFMNHNTFQVHCAGIDGRFGSIVTLPGSSNPQVPVYFQYPTGKAIAARTSAASVASLYVSGVRGFQDTSFPGAPTLENHVLDNVSNFSSRTLENDLIEE